MNRLLFRGSVLFLIGLTFSQCNPISKLGKDEYLLVKNTITLDKTKHITSENAKDQREDNYETMSDLDGYLQQKPNTKMLGLFKFHLGAYNFATRKRKSRLLKESELDLVEEIDTKIEKIIGEPPVLVSKKSVQKTVEQMQLYLYDKGYFNNRVQDSITYKIYPKHEGGKARVEYLVSPGHRYTIGKLSYQIKDGGIEYLLKNDKLESLLSIGMYYDEHGLDDERERLVKKLKNQGYFFMSKEYIRYIADTSLGGHSIALTMIIDRFKEKTEAGVEEKNHQRYKIRSVYIQPDFFPEELKRDIDTVRFNDYSFLIFAGSLHPNADRNAYIRFKTLSRKVFMKEEEYFNLDNFNNTYKHLASLRIFKFINIEFKRTEADGELICLIQLNPTPKHSVQIEAEGTFASGDLGIAESFSYRNKNTFKGAELLEVSVKTALESQQAFADNTEDIGELGLFNTIQVEPGLKFNFPRLLFPIKEEKIPKRYSPKTELYISYNYQIRSDYTRWIWGGGFAYEWKESTQKTHILAPIYLSSVKIKDDSPILATTITNPFLANSFTNHFISSSRYSFIYTSQQLNKKVNFTYFRGDLEFAGNAVKGINSVTSPEPDSTIFGIYYAQYAKADLDVRNYQFINRHSTLVFRFAAGLGLPYENSEVMPFEKSYFSGGANGLRAWQSRNVGPGSYIDTTITKGHEGDQHNHNQIADIKLEWNIESRFEFIGPLEGAAFLDAGNIWLTGYDKDRPKGQFDFNSFYNEIAIGGGLGIRLNYEYFIIRVDAAVKIKDPREQAGQRWVLNDAKFSTIVYNLGIGYPF
ncbi:MAG: BamA/TamA family outer membrane protein [Flavobacteriales bacterium]|nr:BamA/TamA family outer membrane protein [Flavobacteriales bacterium]